MTESEKANHAEKVKRVMIEHLTALGYPDITDEKIMSELKNMWIKIEDAGLVTEDMSYNSFCAHANNQFLRAQMQDMLVF